jgi:hypothetical protein
MKVLPMKAAIIVMTITDKKKLTTMKKNRNLKIIIKKKHLQENKNKI